MWPFCSPLCCRGVFWVNSSVISGLDEVQLASMLEIIVRRHIRSQEGVNHAALVSMIAIITVDS